MTDEIRRYAAEIGEPGDDDVIGKGVEDDDAIEEDDDFDDDEDLEDDGDEDEE